MGLFNKTKKKENKKVNIESVVGAIFQMILKEIDHVDQILKKMNISCDFYYLTGSTIGFYYSIWYVLIKRKDEELAEEFLTIVKEKVKLILNDMCEKDNINSEKYINHFDEQLSKAIKIADKSFEEDSDFVDQYFTSSYVSSFVHKQDASIITSGLTIRVMTNWVVPTIKIIKENLFNIW